MSSINHDINARLAAHTEADFDTERGKLIGLAASVVANRLADDILGELVMRDIPGTRRLMRDVGIHEAADLMEEEEMRLVLQRPAAWDQDAEHDNTL